MIIIKVQGRLGNQIFAYALYKKFQVQGVDVRLDFSQLPIDGLENELKKVFDLEVAEASEDEIQALGDCKKNIAAKIRRKIGFRKESHHFESDLNYDERILSMDGKYLEGFWQSERYFAGIEAILRHDLNFSHIDENCALLASELHTQNAVSVHIRRGDYLQKKFSGIYGNICTESYYSQAIAYIKRSIPDAKFYIFTDDPDWANAKFAEKEFIVVLGNTGEKSYQDLYLMSQCKHNIIANSSFSWWGAWLNSNTDKIVIAPAKWINTQTITSIYCKNWIVMDGNSKGEDKDE